MSLLGKAAMLLTFDIEDAAIGEHDDWHTHEHLPERLSIPGFLRGTRWVSVKGSPRYTVIYEVERLETLRSDAYLKRLNNPTPWTSKMMAHYRGMIRGLCSVERSYGLGTGHYSLLVRFKPAADSATDQLAGRPCPPTSPVETGTGQRPPSARRACGNDDIGATNSWCRCGSRLGADGNGIRARGRRRIGECRTQPQGVANARMRERIFGVVSSRLLAVCGRSRCLTLRSSRQGVALRELDR